MRRPSLRAGLEILGAWAFFFGGIGTMLWIDHYKLKRLEVQIDEAMLYLAAPLLECRAGRSWPGMAEWKRRHPDCDLSCAIEMLEYQLERQKTESSWTEAKLRGN